MTDNVNIGAIFYRNRRDGGYEFATDDASMTLLQTGNDILELFADKDRLESRLGVPLACGFLNAQSVAGDETGKHTLKLVGLFDLASVDGNTITVRKLTTAEKAGA